MIVNLHKKVDAKLAVAISIFPKRAPGGSGSSRVSSSASQSAAAARVHPSIASDPSTPPVAVSAFHKKKIIHSLIMHFFQIIGTIYYRSRTRLFPLTPHRRHI